MASVFNAAATGDVEMTPSDRRFRLRLYKHAVRVGQSLMDSGLLCHVTHEQPFRDGHYFYRLRLGQALELNAVERRSAEYDVVVIGAGAAGLTAASFAGKIGARVALIERDRLGGDCTWHGCVPSKTLIAIARRAHTIRTAISAHDRLFGGGEAAGGEAGPLPPPATEAFDGLSVQGQLSVDMDRIADYIQGVIQEVYHEETPEAIARKGVDVILGSASFVDSRSVRVRLSNPERPVVFASDTVPEGNRGPELPEQGPAAQAGACPCGPGQPAGAAAAGGGGASAAAAATPAAAAAAAAASPCDCRLLTANKFVIATGAAPLLPKLPGLNPGEYHTYETIFANRVLPRRMVVVGCGPIGCELAQAYHYLGARVTILGRKLLGTEGEEARQALKGVFEDEGLRWIPARPQRVERNPAAADPMCVPLPGGAPQPPRGRHIPADAPFPFAVHVAGERVEADLLLVATGRRPNLVPLQLENAGVPAVPAGTGLTVNDYLQVPGVAHIYGAGDCVAGVEQFTHLAGKLGFVAARNALFPGSSPGKVQSVPRATYTHPEVASIGLSAEACRAKYGDKVKIYTRPNTHIDRSLCEGERRGFYQICVLGDGSIVGATIVGARAGEVITELSLAHSSRLKVRDVAMAVHPYPTHNEGLRQVASDAASEQLNASAVGKVIMGLYAGSRRQRSTPLLVPHAKVPQ